MRSLHEELLLRARDDHRRTGRWIFIGLVALAALHILVILPWAGAGRERAAAREEAEQLAIVAGELAEIGPPIAACETVARSTLEPALEDLLDALHGDLLRLQATRDYLEVVLNPDAAALDSSEPSTASGDDDDKTVRRFEISDSDEILALSRARTREETLSALEPLVETLILRPRYRDLQELWRRQAAAGIEARIDGAAAAIPQLRGHFPAAEAAWDGLAAELTALRRIAREAEIKPPGEPPHWWAQEAKTAGEDVVLRLDQEIREGFLSPPVLDTIAASTARVLRRHRELTETVEARRQALAARLDAGGGEGSAAFLRRTGLSASDFALGFPFLLGILLAVALLLPLRPWREMALFARHLPPDPALHTWLQGGSRIGTPLRTIAALLWIVGAVVLHHGDGDWIGILLWAVPGALLVTTAGLYRRTTEKNILDAFPATQNSALELGWEEESIPFESSYDQQSHESQVYDEQPYKEPATEESSLEETTSHADGTLDAEDSEAGFNHLGASPAQAETSETESGVFGVDHSDGVIESVEILR